MALNLFKIHPKLKIIARNLPRVAGALGFNVRITSGYRSYATQSKLFQDYLQGIAHYPANPPGTSTHEKGMALDILSTNTEKLVALLTSVGLKWAGPVDPIHFEIYTARPVVGGPRLNDLPPTKAKVWTEMTVSEQKKALLDAINKKIMKPW